MKINSRTLCKAIQGKDFLDYCKRHASEHEARYRRNHLPEVQSLPPDHERVQLHQNQFSANEARVKFWNETGFRTLLFSKAAKEALQDYLVPKEIRAEVLRTLPNRKDIIQLDEETCFRYTKDPDRVCVCFSWRMEEQAPDGTISSGIENLFFSINLQTEVATFDHSPKYRKTGVYDPDEYVDNYYATFMLAVTYLELTEVSLEVVKPGASSSGTKKEGKVKNESPEGVILVRKNWNIEKINLEGIKVRGHWRLQPYGTGRASYKYIWINAYEKGITIRMAQKEAIDAKRTG